MELTRRELLVAAAPIAAAGVLGRLLPAALAGDEVLAPPFALPPLPYSFDALEPHIDARTMEIHHDKHHAAYVANLNKAVADHADLAKGGLDAMLRNLDAVPEPIRAAVRNNGGGHANHSLFWTGMGPGKGGEPKDAIGKAIGDAFGGFAKFRDAFTDAAMKRFGSGWAWLAWKAGAVEITSTANQDTPLSEGRVPIVGLDVWEHAYYLKYQNRRAEYVAAWWNVIDWEEANRRLEAARA